MRNIKPQNYLNIKLHGMRNIFEQPNKQISNQNDLKMILMNNINLNLRLGIFTMYSFDIMKEKNYF